MRWNPVNLTVATAAAPWIRTSGTRTRWPWSIAYGRSVEASAPRERSRRCTAPGWQAQRPTADETPQDGSRTTVRGERRADRLRVVVSGVLEEVLHEHAYLLIVVNLPEHRAPGGQRNGR